MMSKFKCARCGKIIDSTGHTLYIHRCGNCGNVCDANSKCPYCGMYSYGLDGEDLRDYSKRWICSCGCVNYYDNTRYYESSTSGGNTYSGGGSGEWLGWIFLIVVVGVPAAAWIFYGIDPVSLLVKVLSPVVDWLFNH